MSCIKFSMLWTTDDQKLIWNEAAKIAESEAHGSLEYDRFVLSFFLVLRLKNRNQI